MGVRESLNCSELIEKYSEFMAADLLTRSKEVGHDVWPSPIFHPIEGDVYVSKYLFPFIHKLLRKLRGNHSDDQIARMLKYPSRLAELTYLFATIHFCELPASHRIETACSLLKYVSYLRGGMLSRRCANRILDDETLRSLLDSCRFTSLENLDTREADETRSSIGKANSLLFSYSELLYFCHNRIGYESHGPYSRDSDVVIITDYHDLKPVFWEPIIRSPLDRVSLVRVYSRVDVEFDFVGRAYAPGGLTQKLKGYSIVEQKNNTCREIEDLQDLRRRIENGLREAVDRVRKMNRVELMKKYGETFFYAIKPLADACNEEWYPPGAFYADVEQQLLTSQGKELAVRLRELGGSSESERFPLLKNIFRPR